MDINNASVGTRFFTFHCWLDDGKPRFGVTQWSLVSAALRVAVRVFQGVERPDSSRVIGAAERLFETEAEAWNECAARLTGMAETILMASEECRKNRDNRDNRVLDLPEAV